MVTKKKSKVKRVTSASAFKCIKQMSEKHDYPISELLRLAIMECILDETPGVNFKTTMWKYLQKQLYNEVNCRNKINPITLEPIKQDLNPLDLVLMSNGYCYSIKELGEYMFNSNMENKSYINGDDGNSVSIWGDNRELLALIKHPNMNKKHKYALKDQYDVQVRLQEFLEYGAVLDEIFNLGMYSSYIQTGALQYYDEKKYLPPLYERMEELFKMVDALPPSARDTFLDYSVSGTSLRKFFGVADTCNHMAAKHVLQIYLGMSKKLGLNPVFPKGVYVFEHDTNLFSYYIIPAPNDKSIFLSYRKDNGTVSIFNIHSERRAMCVKSTLKGKMINNCINDMAKNYPKNIKYAIDVLKMDPKMFDVNHMGLGLRNPYANDAQIEAARPIVQNSPVNEVDYDLHRLEINKLNFSDNAVENLIKKLTKKISTMKNAQFRRFADYIEERDIARATRDSNIVVGSPAGPIVNIGKLNSKMGSKSSYAYLAFEALKALGATESGKGFNNLTIKKKMSEMSGRDIRNMGHLKVALEKLKKNGVIFDDEENYEDFHWYINTKSKHIKK